MNLILKKPYIFYTILIFTLYVVLSFFISGFYTTIPLIAIYFKTINWGKLFLSVFLTITIGLLVAINSVLSYIRYTERKTCRDGATLTAIGTIGGLTGVCPLCVVGIFPLILSAIGISFTFATLPFNGIEVQAGILALLLVGTYFLHRPHRTKKLK
jgi:hypothetical protein